MHLVVRAVRQRLLTVSLWSALWACADATGPDLTGTTYELRLFNGAQLPTRSGEVDSGTFYELLRTTLVFYSADSAVATTEVRRVASAIGLDTVYVNAKRVAYVTRQRNIWVSHSCWTGICPNCAGPACPADDVGVLRGDSLILDRPWDVRHPTMVYVRVGE